MLTHDEIRKAFADGKSISGRINTYTFCSDGKVWGCCHEGPQCCEFDFLSIDDFIECMESWGDFKHLTIDKY